jgi:hypothetical protein
MQGGKKYSETVVRHAAVTAQGHEVEILERLTFQSDELPDGQWSPPQQILQRFDLRTGQRVNHLEGDRFQVDVSGEDLTRLPAQDAPAQET